MSKTTIHINGRHYDSATGALLHMTEDVSPHASANDHNTQADTHFISVRRVTPKHTSKPVAKSAVHAVKPSRTLMRSAVKKPAAIQLHAQHALPEESAPELSQIVPKLSVSSINRDRLKRAQSMVRSAKVKRFDAGVKEELFRTQYTHVPVMLAPDKPEETTVPVPAPERTNSPDDLFSQAVARANHFVDVKSHSAAHRKKTKRHFTSMAVGVSALLLIAGFAAYLNAPSLQIKVAGIRAGVGAASPDFEKAGFAYSGVNATPTKRVIGLSAGASQYVLSEQATNWDGRTMISNVASVHANGAPNYTAVDVGDATVYRFGSTQATWVKDGTWYTISGEQPLTDTQLKALVTNS